jgi:hypothetical protein
VRTLIPLPVKFLLETGGGLLISLSRKASCSSMVLVNLAASLAFRAVLGLNCNVGEVRFVTLGLVSFFGAPGVGGLTRAYTGVRGL